MTGGPASFWKAPQAWIGLALLAIAWPLNWTLPGTRTAYLFFPLWLGYVLVVDGLVGWRKGTSLLSRSRWRLAWLFLVSAPAWWLFEIVNHRTRNWEYRGGEAFSSFEYFVLSTVSFSTVMPAVFETAELVGSFRWVERCRSGPAIPLRPEHDRWLLVAGMAMLTLTLAWPRWFYPFVWASLVLILEPINAWLGRPHLLQPLRHGDWRLAVCLSIGALGCGFFWELWNYYSYPKWIYHTPGTEFLYLFEMPALGYFGYLFFAWELYSLRNLLWPEAAPMQIEHDRGS